MLLKIETFSFQKNYTKYEKKFPNEIVHLKRIYKFISKHFLIGHEVFVLIVESVIKNYILYQIYARYVKNVRKENCLLKKDLQIISWLFFHKSYIFSFIHQKRFYENKKFNFPAKIYKIRKNCKKQNCLFSKDLQSWSRTFFHRSYFFCSLMKIDVNTQNQLRRYFLVE